MEATHNWGLYICRPTTRDLINQCLQADRGYGINHLVALYEMVTFCTGQFVCKMRDVGLVFL